MDGRYLITEDNISINSDCDELILMDDYINAYVATWFDVDKRFGTQTNDSDDYINVYANYFPKTKELELSYIIKYANGEDSDEIIVDDLQPSEATVIYKLMDKEFRKEFGYGMKDFDMDYYLNSNEGDRVNFFENLSKDELIKILHAYDGYIQDANENNRYQEGWFPVCLSEFIDNEYCQLLADEELDWGG